MQLQAAANSSPQVAQLKTAQAQVNANSPIQRQITIGSDSGKSASDLADEFQVEAGLGNDKRFKEYIPLLRKVIFPAYDKSNRTFDSKGNFTNHMLYNVIPHLEKLANVEKHDTIGGYFQAQDQAQTHIDQNRADFAGMVTTAGFEAEFADMKNSPLSGVSHVEIAESAEPMPWTGGYFLLETDASDALELVTPPMLLPTVKGAALPSSEVVRRIDDLLKKSLYNVLTVPNNSYFSGLMGAVYDEDWKRKYITQTLDAMILKLNAITGYTFALKNKLEIKAENLSHNSQLGTLGSKLQADANDNNKLKMDSSVLGNVTVGKSEKQDDQPRNIGTQLNFATDIETARLVAAQGSGTKFSYVYRALEEAIAKRLPKPAPSTGKIDSFYAVLAEKLATLFAVPSQAYVKARQQTMYTQLQNNVNQGQNVQTTLNTQQAFTDFQIHAGLLSVAKNASPIWVKDHVASLGKGLLDQNARQAVLPNLNNHTLAGWQEPSTLKSILNDTDQVPSNLSQHWTAFVVEMVQAMTGLLTELGNGFQNGDASAATNLYNHNSGYLGARQDTYQNPANIRMPGLRSERLHVAESRFDAGSDLLKKAENKL